MGQPGRLGKKACSQLHRFTQGYFHIAAAGYSNITNTTETIPHHNLSRLTLRFKVSCSSFIQLGMGRTNMHVHVLEAMGRFPYDHFCVHRRDLHTRPVIYWNTLSRQYCQHMQLSSTQKETDFNGDTEIKPALEVMTPNVPPPDSVHIVPGKGPPPAPPIDCCMAGCANCVWIQYAQELKRYYSKDEGQDQARQAIEQIDNPGLRMFIKLELGFL